MSRKDERNPAELSQERKLLIQRYMNEWLEGAGRAQEPEAEPAEDEGVPAERPVLQLAPEPVDALEPDDEDTYEDLPRRRRGRPRGARKRRQVHFHVDPDEDQMLLRAAGRFGSQQKALIAALHALNEVLALRDQVEILESENSRQRRLLAEAQALFRSS